VSAATDLQLAATPAFGNKRPDVAWLLQTLQQLWQQETGLPQHEQALLAPVVAAAGKLLAQHSDTKRAAAAAVAAVISRSNMQVAAQLLDSVCGLLAGSSGNQSLRSAEGCLPVMKQLLAVLQQHPELPPLQNLQAALSAAVAVDVAAGNGRILEAAERLAGSKQLASEDMAQLYWAAVEGAAAQTVQSSSSRELLLLYWSTAVRSSADVATSSKVAAAVVAAMATDGGLPQQLLAQPLPTAVLAALMRAAAAVAHSGDAVLPLLLAHALQHQQLGLLPADLLPQLLQTSLAAAAAPGAAATVAFADCLKVLELLLQQQDSKGISTQSAQLLVETVGARTDNMLRFEAMLQQYTGSRTVSALLALLLQQASTDTADPEPSWRLFQLLQLHSTPSQQQVPACSALLVQQSKAGTAAATD
jgi:hypothetical protein